MCHLCLDNRATVLIYMLNGSWWALDRFIELDACDDCEADGMRALENHPHAGGMAHVMRWAA